MGSPGRELLEAGRKSGIAGNLRSYKERTRERGGRAAVVGTALVTAILIASIVLAMALNDRTANDGNDLVSRSASWLLLPLVPVYQHKDTAMPCVAPPPPCFPPNAPHVWNDAKGPDGVYGSPDDCPHCSCYCAPASIAMIANYRGVGPPLNQQDDIYDAGKSSLGDVPGDLILSTHGVGMFHGIGGWPPEVQISMTWSVSPIIQHNQGDASALIAVQLKQYIFNSHPVLWLDNGGWPANMSMQYPGDPSEEPPTSYRYDQGHAKVIGGYDDNDTADTSDDRCLIYDPWPEYTDMAILPANTSLGPGGTYDPYWQPLNDVNLADIQDVYLVDTFPDVEIGESDGILLAPLTLLVVTVVMYGMRRRKLPA